MARFPRIDVPGCAQHVYCRGNNRSDLFRIDRDRRVYLRYLRQAAAAHDCEIHAYALMTNHVHLLVTGKAKGAISRMMHSLGLRYARYVNSAYGRTGTLFEGRFRSSLIDTDLYLLTCMRYIELNPVRAAMVQSPADYPWSSFHHNAWGKPSLWLSKHKLYRDLGDDEGARLIAYRSLIERPLSAQDLATIRQHTARDRVMGSEAFRGDLEVRLGRPVGITKPGPRPFAP